MSGSGRSGKRRVGLGRRMRSALLLLVAGGALVLALAYFLRGSSIRREPPRSTVIDIGMDAKGFDRREVRVEAGQQVTIRFTNRARTALSIGGEHQFAIDELGVDIVVPPGAVDSATFTPAVPGRYVFYCDVCCGGRENPSMTGTLIVDG